MISEQKIKSCKEEGIPISIAGHDIPYRGSWRILKPVINLKKCIKCRLCWIYCPDTAMKLTKNNFPYSDPRVCKGCGICSDICPVKTIKMERDSHRDEG